ncbi:hypothetical protein VFPPC_15782 [Pochonia chlamydosporia 170]|uniref:Uncharacterized protein n=1 Tax=Pochonia chlamydosporia 170 TaxID=1380566 RepID=A0A179FR74_METCM|nr:hypothetical protein VFPPC_15782 [Pochonia chlamydosporia 170]OAQ68102.1 hypothetical protein VFPPC_15782 [Pochonia chlamydosporia 170]
MPFTNVRCHIRNTTLDWMPFCSMLKSLSPPTCCVTTLLVASLNSTGSPPHDLQYFCLFMPSARLLALLLQWCRSQCIERASLHKVGHSSSKHLTTQRHKDKIATTNTNWQTCDIKGMPLQAKQRTRSSTDALQQLMGCRPANPVIAQCLHQRAEECQLSKFLNRQRAKNPQARHNSAEHLHHQTLYHNQPASCIYRNKVYSSLALLTTAYIQSRRDARQASTALHAICHSTDPSMQIGRTQRCSETTKRQSSVSYSSPHLRHCHHIYSNMYWCACHAPAESLNYISFETQQDLGPPSQDR